MRISYMIANIISQSEYSLKAKTMTKYVWRYIKLPCHQMKVVPLTNSDTWLSFENWNTGRRYIWSREVKKASIDSIFSSMSLKILDSVIHLIQILPAYLWLTVHSWLAPLEGRPTNDGCWLENGWDSPHLAPPGYAHALVFPCLVISTLPAWNQRCESYSRWQGPGSLGSRLEGTSRNLTPNEASSKRMYLPYRMYEK